MDYSTVRDSMWFMQALAFQSTTEIFFLFEQCPVIVYGNLVCEPIFFFFGSVKQIMHVL